MLRTIINRYTCSFALVFGGAFAWTALAQAQAPAARTPGAQQKVTTRSLQPIDNRTPKELPGEVLVRLAPGANAQQIAASFGISVKKQLRFAPNTYVFAGVTGALDKMVASLRGTAGVMTATKNSVYVPSALPQSDPNDPLLQRQWAMRLLNASNVWGITVGERFIGGPKDTAVVGMIDSGPETSLFDLYENIDPNGYDFILDQPYEDFAAPIFFDSHGTNVASCIVSTNNNNEGLASLPWEGVKIMPCRVNQLVTVDDVTTSVFSSSAIVDAIYYCIQQQVDVINMSFAPASVFSEFSDDLMEQAISDAYEQGIVLVGSSGNDRFFGTSSGVNFPANLPEVISVGAVGPSGEVAYYSNGGSTLDLVAPGGNDPNGTDLSRQVLVADSFGFSGVQGIPSGYAFQQGTSLSCGYASSAIAMLITQGALDESLEPTEQVEAIRELLHTTARKPLGQFSTEYGYGILDAAAALRSITQYIDVTTPGPNETTESFAEPLEASIIQPVQDPLDYGEFQVFTNGRDITEETDEDGDPLVEIVDPDFGLIRYQPGLDTRYNIGINRINITADSALYPGCIRSLEGPAEGYIPERAYRFRVTPRVEQAGIKMFSVPYQLLPEANTLQFLFGGNLVRTARWVPERGEYAYWDIVGSPQDPEADLVPEIARDLDLDNLTLEDQDALLDEVGVIKPPAGLGFFARVQTPTQVQLLGKSIRSGSYQIRLKPGFNMIGNPYTFRVPWNVVNVRYGNEVMSISEAADRNLIRNTIWRYQNGAYRFQALPQGELVNWEGHWVRSFKDLTLIIPRVASVIGQTSGVNVGSANPIEADGWKTTFRASAAGQNFGEVHLGATKSARDGYGQEDVENPPAPLANSDLRIAHRDWGKFNGGYAQDIRARKDRSQSWTLEVETSKAGIPVKLSWDRLPSGIRGYVKVEGERKTYPLQQGGLQFTPGKAGVRRVTVVANQALGA